MSDAPATAHRPHALRLWQRVLLWPFGAVLRLWTRTLRFDLAPADAEAFATFDRPVALVLWHNRLFIAAELMRRCRRGRPFYALISASRDGAWLAGFFELVGIPAVRGSSSRGAREAVSALIDVLREGHDIGITPDGPRGPRYDFKAGGLIVARRAQAPMLLVGAAFEHAAAMGSWDGFYLPRPFSRVRVRCERIDADALPRDREAALAQLRGRMIELNPDAPSA